MVNKGLPQVAAFTLSDAKELLRKAGYKVIVKEVLPPGYRIESVLVFRVVRQQLLQNKLVELVVTIDFGKRG